MPEEWRVIDHGANVQRFDLLPGQDVEWTLEQASSEEGRMFDKLKLLVNYADSLPEADEGDGKFFPS